MIELYDAAFRALGPLDTAIKWGYKQTLNELATAQIQMAADDPAHERIDAPASWARLTDGAIGLGMFRFGAIPEDAHAPGARTTYKLTHAACTLLDDMLIGWHELGGTGVHTRQVLEYILARQTTARWVLGRCDFDAEYQYNFEDVTLLEAVMSLGEVLTEDYEFEFMANGPPPWTLNLVRLSDTPVCSLVYGRGMTGISRSVEEGVVTRLVGRGYGEGDNQLTIAEVNGGCEWLDADTIGRYGVRVGIHADRRQTDPATLKARMEAILRLGKAPRVSYNVDALDLYPMTGERIDLHMAGDSVLVLDSKYGKMNTRIVCREKDDVEGDGGAVTVTLSTAATDIADELNEVLEKIGVQELYSQGATNMYSQQIADNADERHPLELRFYVPGNAIRINSCLLTWKLERFRSYAEITMSDGESTRTSSSGGGATVSTPQQFVSDRAATGGPQGGEGTSALYTEAAGDHTHEGSSHRHSVDSHIHNMNGHKHSSASAGPSPAATTANGSGNTSYTRAGTEAAGSHTHRYDHWHAATVSITIPPMEFTLTPHTHRVTLPAHKHNIEHGIYEGDRASGMALRVDGQDVPAEAIGDKDEVDICKYMRKNSDGKIVRDAWHEVEFVPNGLTRIVANLFFQVFIQSRGAGDY